ncbi:MAG: hypothetical protein ACJ703_10595 [Nitrososphaera sp.]
MSHLIGVKQSKYVKLDLRAEEEHHLVVLLTNISIIIWEHVLTTNNNQSAPYDMHKSSLFIIDTYSRYKDYDYNTSDEFSISNTFDIDIRN